MKHILLIGIFILNCCSNIGEYRIERNFKSVVNNQNCVIKYYYPKFISNDSREGGDELNDILAQYVDYENYAHNCSSIKNEKRIIKGDYKITMMTEDILSIDFITEINFGKDDLQDTVYHSIVVDPKKIGDERLSFLQSDPKLLLPEFDRGDLYNYVEDFNSKNQDKINLIAYKSMSNHVLTWGISKDTFLLYVGGEGEWFGKHKLKIPLSELKKDSNR